MTLSPKVGNLANSSTGTRSSDARPPRARPRFGCPRSPSADDRGDHIDDSLRAQVDDHIALAIDLLPVFVDDYVFDHIRHDDALYNDLVAARDHLTAAIALIDGG